MLYVKTQKALILTLILSLIAPYAHAEVPRTEGFEYYKKHAYEITLALCKTDLDPITLVAPLMGPPGELIATSRSSKRQQLYRFMWDAANDAIAFEMDPNAIPTLINNFIPNEKSNAEEKEQTFTPKSNSWISPELGISGYTYNDPKTFEVNGKYSQYLKTAAKGFAEFMNNDFPSTRLSPEFVGLITSDGYKVALQECYGDSSSNKAAFENGLVIADAIAKGLVLYGLLKLPEGFNAAGNKILATKFAMNHPYLLAKPVKAIMAFPKALDVVAKITASAIPLSFIGLTAGIKYKGDSTAVPIAAGVTGLVLGGAAAAKFGWKGTWLSLATATIGGYFISKSGQKPSTSGELKNENDLQSTQNSLKQSANLIRLYQQNIEELNAEKATNPSPERLKKIEEKIQSAQNGISNTKLAIEAFCLDPRLKNSEDCKL